ncbi:MULTISPECIES: hypothetical protein [Enterococcus]|uniref:hypothetical protein n=1 Tax=Enterococcus TaxID=1350 RepID=UPI0001B6DB6E|nr:MULTISPECIES: hypothetical protein [Enterococcus]AYJ44078.1 hypothetical protein D8N35_02780 [Enterococcus casseliflavus]EEV29479.1 predicted protein [Enterococcus casseliflavus EC30]EEV35977.1 predicted protein [Enterococcus casseliflavus EC10]MBS5813305.1 hypothetical protein [Enterococcus casseliflavus]MBX9114949.1 hypothetical protein [Enterococcus casseliflavus]
MLSEKQEKLKQMLLTPIVVDKLTNTIQKEGDTIKSAQVYRGVEDPDMSDVSIAFYEIIYKNTIPKNQQGEFNVFGKSDDKGNIYINDFANVSFAGDTMNSFKTISGKLIKELSIDGEKINKQYYMPNDSKGRMRLIFDSDADEYTQKIFYEFYKLYHSLANFWIIPIEMGRKSSKTISIDNFEFRTQDYMGRFLSEIRNNWNRLKKQGLYNFYFKNFEDYSEFIEKHFIIETDYLESPKDETENFGSLNEKDAVSIVSGMITAIKNRAELLSKSEYAEQLWILLSNITTDSSDKL